MCLNQITPNHAPWSQTKSLGQNCNFLKFILQRQNTESCMIPQNEDLNVHYKSCMIFGVRHYNYILGKMPNMQGMVI